MATVTSPIPDSRGIIFHDVSWTEYEAQLRIVGDRRIRVTYDQGTMEVFLPSFGHEDESYRLGRIIDTLTEELDLPVKAGRTTTQKRQDLDRGAEPDQCCWFGENARTMAGKTRLDLTIDPAPDLAIEVDLSRNSLERLPIFAAIGILEVWRLASGSLTFLHLQPDRTYEPREFSRAFPKLRVGDLAPVIAQGRASEDTTWVRAFRRFVRDELMARP